jgi:RNA polymerase sigma factor (sigma-70 family)
VTKKIRDETDLRWENIDRCLVFSLFGVTPVPVQLVNSVIDPIRRAAFAGERHGLTDAGLLGHFVTCRDNAAFAALVARHGPMVMGVCGRVVGNHHDAEDAFQATFLVLARKAASVSPRERLGSWLYGVAYRAATKLRAMNARRNARETLVPGMPEPVAKPPNDLWQELRPLLDRELNLLPDGYRTAIILCDLQGWTGKEAARQTGWPEGTVASRLVRGRKLLAKRLARRGVTLSVTTLISTLAAARASATVPREVARLAVDGACRMSTVAAPAAVSALTDGISRDIVVAKWKTLSLVVLSIGVVASAIGSLSVVQPRPGERQFVAHSGLQPDNAKDERDSSDKRGERARANGQPDMPEGFIIAPGEYRLYDGKLSIKVWEENGRIRWHAVFPGGPGDGNTTLGSGITGMGKRSPWFIFPASADVVWCYEPEVKRIYLIKRRNPDDFVVKHANLPADWTSVLELEKLPEKVLKRLPPELRPTRDGRN